MIDPADLFNPIPTCQPIGCDHGFHLPGCPYIETDDESNRYQMRKTDPQGRIPDRAYADDAGLDLATTQDADIMPNQPAMLPVGVAGALPTGTFGLILGRSSTWAKHKLMVMPSVIDVGWRGELFVSVWNPGPYRVKLQAGQRVAQIIVLPTWGGSVQEVGELPPHDRGLNGFGSSDAAHTG